MSKPIKLNEFADIIREKLRIKTEELLSQPTCDTSFTVKLDIKDVYKEVYGSENAIVNFTASAYYKMMTLTQQSNDELAGHGVVVRNSDYEYTVTDIIVYPQQASGATVEAADEYSQWLADLDDETFNSLRFQFHSHVNMACNPSTVDVCFYEKMLKDVQDFYIFAIINKRNELFINIYDVAHNIIFEKNDIDVYIIDECGKDITAWAKENIKNLIKPRPCVVNTKTEKEKKEKTKNLGRNYQSDDEFLRLYREQRMRMGLIDD